jgi:hypothetical protein
MAAIVDETRMKAAVFTTVDLFLSAVTNDKYPDVGFQRVFGVQFGNEVGATMFRAWITLIGHRAVDAAGMFRALCEGRMPQFFEAAIRGLPRERHSGFTHALLAEKLLSRVAWDYEMLDIFHSLTGGSACEN